MVLYELKSLIAPRRARIFDGAVLIIVTLAALFYCYGVEVFPDDSKPHTLEADELLLVSNILFGGLFVCALRWLIEQQRGISRIAAELASGASREPVPPFLFDKPNAKCDVGTNENFGSHFEAVRVQPLASSARAAIKQVAPTPPGRPSKSATIEAAIDALTAEGVDVSKLSRKDAYSRIREKASKLGANVEVGFSVPVVQRALVRRYGPRA
ncbi:MAG: hypothetical protein WAM55_01435 [Methylovirgula sp.]